MDPLANLQDIHLPAEVHSWPIAPGWWLLAAILIGTIVFVTIKIRKKTRQLLIKKQALKHLSANEQLTTEQSIEILKWTCMHYFKRNEVAKLHGHHLIDYLAKKLPEEFQSQFHSLSENAMLQQYRKSTHQLYAGEFQQAAQLWVENAMFWPKEAKAGENV